MGGRAVPIRCCLIWRTIRRSGRPEPRATGHRWPRLSDELQHWRAEMAAATGEPDPIQAQGLSLPYASFMARMQARPMGLSDSSARDPQCRGERRGAMLKRMRDRHGPDRHHSCRRLCCVRPVHAWSPCAIETGGARAGRRGSASAYRGICTPRRCWRATGPHICSVATGGFEYASDHYEPTMQALQAGAHVLCEKPISNSLAQGTEMVEHGAALNRCFAIDLNHRFTPAARAAKRWQEEGCLGDLLFVNMALWIGKFGPLRLALLSTSRRSIRTVSTSCAISAAMWSSVHCFAMKAPGAISGAPPRSTCASATAWWGI